VERNVTDLQTLFLVLAELYGKHAFDAGKKCVAKHDAEFVALLGPHTEKGLTKRMVNRWLAGWNNASSRSVSATVTGQTGRMTVSALTRPKGGCRMGLRADLSNLWPRLSSGRATTAAISGAGLLRL
jgi:hypothetical protein